MDFSKVNQWLSLLANFGVVIGLILLVIEIRQNTDFIRQEAVVARADFGQGSFVDFADVHQILVDPEFANIFSKTVRNLGELTVTETIQVSHFLSRVMTMLFRDAYGARIGVYEMNNELIEDALPQFFGNQFAQSWWQAVKDHYPPEFAQLIDAEMALVSVESNREFYGELHSGQ